MSPKLSKNAYKLELILKEITLFEKNVKNVDKSNSHALGVIKTKVEHFENKLENTFSELSQHESDEYFERYIKFKDLLLNWIVELETKIPRKENKTDNSSRLESVAVKLPKLEVPHFFGNNELWLSFKEIFKSSILENKSLNDVEKLTYLHSCIRGDAAKLIRGFAITPENLTHCWELLCARYENKRQLAISQINKIFKMKVMKANNSKLMLDVIDICNEAIRNLKTLNLENNELTDLIIINFLTSKMEETVIQRWELMLDNDTFPSLDTFKTFIEKEARSMQEHKFSKPEIKGFQPKTNTVVKKSNVYNTVVKKENINNEVKFHKCILCPQNQTHALFRCPTFHSMNVNDKWRVVKDNQLCVNCLRDNHTVETCRIGFSCKNCSARHHTLLHIYSVNNQERQTQSVSTVTNSCTKSKNKNHVLLSTAVIKVKSHTGKMLTCRALLDNGSQNCLISKHCAQRLQLSMQQTKHRLVGINDIYAETCLYSTNFEFSPYFSVDSFKVTALVVNKVTTSLPNFDMEKVDWPHLNNLRLADPSYFVESEVDILLGADIFLSLVTGTPILGPMGSPSALPTKLGHLLSGSVTSSANQNSSLVCHTLVNIENTLKEFWELETIHEPIKPNDEDELCDAIFAKSHTRNSEGRYTVKLPFKEDSNLGDSKEGALKRFFSLEKKLQSNEQLKQKYIQFMEEYQLLSHMTPITSDSAPQNYILPHHGVINENSSTTQLRVVFDGSFKTSNGKSLNDVLLKGKKLQSDIFVILLKFRTFPVAFSSDITKMYRQIMVATEDTSFQQIFWRKSPDEPLKVYTLNTVTYGTACAPYLAIRTLKQLCNDEKERFPQAIKLAQDHFYVDDLLAGADSVDSAKIIIKELLDLMSSGGFELRKWSCSHPEVIAQLPDSLKASTFTHSFQENSAQKILGLYWDLNIDSFQVRAVPSDNVSTKRQLLSIIARIFDPLGFVAPSTVILKIILQDVWKSNIGWDDPLPSDILDLWNKFQAEIHYFKEIKIPRYIHVVNSVRIEVHGFCDASIKAYSAVIYLRVICNSPHIFLMASKTRVAPIKIVTLPRLELCGTVLLAELVNTFKKAVNFLIHQTYLWCDSTIALCWIKNPPTKGNQFVQHRVSKIHSLTSKDSWYHISGKSNIADCASRGLYPKQLMQHSEWLNGPTWLIDFDPASLEVDTPTQDLSDTSSDIHDNSTYESTSLLTQINSFLDSFGKFSSYLRLIRTIAWVFRFYNNLKSDSKTKGPLQGHELNASIKTIVKLVQSSSFSSEINQLNSNQPLPKSSKLTALNPFLDKEGILRVGGRLRHQQNINFDQKYPMLLPKNSHFTILVIRHYHHSNLHAGQELVLSLIRQSFWIPDGKSAVRKELRKCLECFKVSAKPISQMMGDLPSARVNPCRAFEKVGLDFAGPISIKCQHARKSSIFKAYICLFICMSTKAVHLELVSSLSSAAFLAALRRFVARRGYPSHVFSDNGSNFVGASAYLKSLFKFNP